jgi:hypothetical protein
VHSTDFFRRAWPLAALTTLALLGGCGGSADSAGARAGESAGPPPDPETTAAAVAMPVAALAYWSGARPEELPLYPAPTAVTTVARAGEIPRVALHRAAEAAAATSGNVAVRIDLLASGAQARLFAHEAPADREFMVLETRWRNVHPRERISRAQLEGRGDRSMGLGNFASGGGSSGSDEMIDADVAYQVPRLIDHVYLVADGVAHPLHEATEELPGGYPLQRRFTIAKHGEEREARFAFLAPKGAKNVALQFFDYEYGHVVVAVRGSAERALEGGSGGAGGRVLARAELEELELVAYSLAFAESYAGATAPSGRRFAVVQIGGRSRSSSGAVQNIVQVDPLKFIWLEGDGGYLYSAASGSTNSAGVLRFTPEVFQRQEVAFLVPASLERMRLALRARGQVMKLDLTDAAPTGLPRARGAHRDGNTMEVLLIGSRRSAEHLVLDLAIRPRAAGTGIEIAADQQFLLVDAAGAETRPDMEASRALPHGPADPLVVQPDTPLRFELAFPVSGQPAALRVRGFDSEGRIRL